MPYDIIKKGYNMSEKKTTVINLWGGPGIGKSVTSALLYGLLATSHRYGTVEQVPEYAKRLAWSIGKKKAAGEDADEDVSLIRDQMHVTSTQAQWLCDVCGQVDIAVVDSPLRSGLVYFEINKRKSGEWGTDTVKEEYRKVESVINEAEKHFDEVNILLKRSDIGGFMQEGRVHSLEESIEVDRMMKQMLDSLGRKYIVIESKTDIASVIGEIEQHLNLRGLGSDIHIEPTLGGVATDLQGISGHNRLK